jgi:hypothetical protein
MTRERVGFDGKVGYRAANAAARAGRDGTEESRDDTRIRAAACFAA